MSDAVWNDGFTISEQYRIYSSDIPDDWWEDVPEKKSIFKQNYNHYKQYVYGDSENKREKLICRVIWNAALDAVRNLCCLKPGHGEPLTFGQHADVQSLKEP